MKRERTRRAARPRVPLAPTWPTRVDDPDAIETGSLLTVLPDGWRCLLLLDDRVQVRSRSGRDLGPYLLGLAAPLAELGRRRRLRELAILDVVLPWASTGPDGWPTLDGVQELLAIDALVVGGRVATAWPLRRRLDALRGEVLDQVGGVRRAESELGSARDLVEQLRFGGSLHRGALLARSPDAPYRAGRRADEWRLVGGEPRTELLLCAICASGALVLGRPTPWGIAYAGATWPSAEWRRVAALCREGPPAFPPPTLWGSLGAVTWCEPELWVAVVPRRRPGAGSNAPRWQLCHLQEDISPAVPGPAGP